jgi:formylglycine-generating enzyme required for sulfatase activity
MHGNVWEWVEDAWHDSYKGEGVPTDGVACVRVVRGGSWEDSPRILRSANRYRDVRDDRNYVLGFRVARTLD